MTYLVDVCKFTAVSSGTGDFVVSAAITGYQTPASAGAVDGKTYRYRAESSDLSQWEVGYGTYTVSSTTLARSTVLFNSSGTTSKISFSSAPNVGIVLLAEDCVPVDGALFGLTLSTAGSSTTFSVAAGFAGDSTGLTIMRLNSSISKTTSAWAVGSTNGSLDTGSIAASTWYHAYLIQRPDTGVVDVLTSLSATAPTMPTNYTLKRRIGSMLTNGSSQWTKFYQINDEFYWDSVTQDFSTTNPGTSAVTQALNVPTGVIVFAFFNYNVAWVGTVSFAYFSSLNVSDQAPSTTAAPFNVFSVGNITSPYNKDFRGVWTNTSAQIRYRVTGSDANVVIKAATIGWSDPRGRLS